MSNYKLDEDGYYGCINYDKTLNLTQQIQKQVGTWEYQIPLYKERYLYNTVDIILSVNLINSKLLKVMCGKL